MRGIVYIAGTGRSGTTLLARLLGRIPGVVDLGEVRFVWDRGLLADEICGCGVPFSSCAFWSEVANRLDGRVLPARAAELAGSVNRTRFTSLPGGRGYGLWPRTDVQRVELAEYRHYLRLLYDAVACVLPPGAILVDSSKSPAHLVNVAAVTDVPLSVLHIVRDSRGVAMSLQRRRLRTESRDETEVMYQAPAFDAATDWLVTNGIFEFYGARAKGIDWRTVLYEDLARSPVETIRTAQRGVFGIDTWDIGPPDVGGRFDLGTSHTVAGNPMRFTTGPIPIEPDERWSQELSKRDQLVVSAVTWPLRLRFRSRYQPGLGYVSSP